MKKKIIGVVGHPSSGKDTVAEYLKEKGFEHFSGGDTLWAIMKDQGLSLDRTSVHDFAKKMRAIHGNHYPANEMVKSIKGHSVISGMRNTAEHDAFNNGFPGEYVLIAVDAPIEFRYELARWRGRIGDEVTFEKFKAEEEKERQATGGTHEVDKLIDLADITITNDSSKEDLFKKVEGFLASRGL